MRRRMRHHHVQNKKNERAGSARNQLERLTDWRRIFHSDESKKLSFVWLGVPCKQDDPRRSSFICRLYRVLTLLLLCSVTSMTSVGPKLLGAVQTRSFRCLWMLEELGIRYQHEVISICNKSSDQSLSLDVFPISNSSTWLNVAIYKELTLPSF